MPNLRIATEIKPGEFAGIEIEYLPEQLQEIVNNFEAKVKEFVVRGSFRTITPIFGTLAEADNAIMQQVQTDSSVTPDCTVNPAERDVAL